MTKPSNYSEIRRIRKEMSAAAGHDVRRLVDLLVPLRERYADRLVDHGQKAEQSDATERPAGRFGGGEPTSAAR